MTRSADNLGIMTSSTLSSDRELTSLYVHTEQRYLLSPPRSLFVVSKCQVFLLIGGLMEWNTTVRRNEIWPCPRRLTVREFLLPGEATRTTNSFTKTWQPGPEHTNKINNVSRGERGEQCRLGSSVFVLWSMPYIVHELPGNYRLKLCTSIWTSSDKEHDEKEKILEALCEREFLISDNKMLDVGSDRSQSSAEQQNAVGENKERNPQKNHFDDTITSFLRGLSPSSQHLGYSHRAPRGKVKDKIAFININLSEAEVVPFTIIHALRSAFVKSKQYPPVYLMQNIR